MLLTENGVIVHRIENHPSAESSNRSLVTVGVVGAGSGLGVALAPQFVDREDLRQEALLLLFGADGDERRAEQFLAQVVHPGRGIGARVLLVEDHLLGEAQPASAVFSRPADTAPAMLGQMPVPAESLLDVHVLTARSTHAAEIGELTAEMVG